MGQVIDGKAVAAKVRAELRQDIEAFRAQTGRPPGLAVVLVGDDPASAIYVANKEKAAQEIGMGSEVIRLPATASQAQIMATVEGLNTDPVIDGMIVQLPLPAGIDANAVLGHIDPDKDADGLHPLNLGRLAADLPGPKPCTPTGVMRLIAETGLALKGKHAVVVGRSEIVGKPMALMLLAEHATVTICHSRTVNLAEEVGRADVVVAAVGRPGLIRGEWIKPGAVVLDVGTTRVEGKLKGDVEYAAAAERAAHITPVPGGVGPMTIAMLLANTVELAKSHVH